MNNKPTADQLYKRLRFLQIDLDHEIKKLQLTLDRLQDLSEKIELTTSEYEAN